ncbi:MAG: hypothetical protein HY687_01650 [Chloroflexi bacterium]|nr:hypothetical protein [Chloroflexota bacterium]
MAVNAMTQTVLEQLGNPAAVDRELQSFRRAARVLSSKNPRMIDRYSKQWIAVYRGRVRAQGRTFLSLITQVDKLKLPREHVIVRFIDKNERTMIL